MEEDTERIVYADRIAFKSSNKLMMERETQCGNDLLMDDEETQLIKAIVEGDYCQKLESLLQNMQESSGMQLNLINDLMDLAKMNVDKFQFDEEFFNLKTVIKKAFSQVKFTANQRKIQLVSEVRKDMNCSRLRIGESEIEQLLLSIYGDERRYLQILLNFLSNALKFTPEQGTVTVRVVVLDVQNIFDNSTNK